MKTDVAGGMSKGKIPAIALLIAVAAWSSAAVAGPLPPAPPADGDALEHGKRREIGNPPDSRTAPSAGVAGISA